VFLVKALGGGWQGIDAPAAGAAARDSTQATR